MNRLDLKPSCLLVLALHHARRGQGKAFTRDLTSLTHVFAIPAKTGPESSRSAQPIQSVKRGLPSVLEVATGLEVVSLGGLRGDDAVGGVGGL